MENGTNGHIAQTKDQLTACVERRNRQSRPSGPAPLGPRKPRAPAGPARKSTRLEGRPAPIYNESALEKADGIERKKRGHLPEHHGAFSRLHHAKLLLGLPGCQLSCLTLGSSKGCMWPAVASEEEIYTEEHTKLLGCYNEPW